MHGGVDPSSRHHYHLIREGAGSRRPVNVRKETPESTRGGPTGLPPGEQRAPYCSRKQWRFLGKIANSPHKFKSAVLSHDLYWYDLY